MDSLIERWKNSVDSQKRRRLKSIEESPLEQSIDRSEGISDYVRLQAQRIVDILVDYDKNPPPMAKFSRVCKVVEEVIERTKKDRVPDAAQELKESTRVKADHSSRVINELEDRLYIAEKERLKLLGDKEDLLRTVEQQQSSLAQAELSRDLVLTLQDAHRLLERSNAALLNDLEQMRKNQAEREATWALELQHLETVISQLSP